MGHSPTVAVHVGVACSTQLFTIYVVGSLFKVRCTVCNHIEENRDSPIVPALKDKGWVLQCRGP